MLKLTTLGGLSVSDDGVARAGATAQRSRLALLALLASAGTAGMSRDKILVYLWPESDTERARHALKQAVYAIRKDLGEDVILGTASLALNPARIVSDVGEFEAAIARKDYAAAASAYTGPFLDGVFVKDSPEFEQWSAEQRERLTHLWTDALERLARGAEETGAWRDAAGWWRKLAVAEPLSAHVAASLIRNLAEAGDTGGALQHYRVYEALVNDELGTPIDPELLSLVGALRDGSRTRAPKRISDATSVVVNASTGAQAAPERDVRDDHPVAPRPRTKRLRRRIWASLGIGACTFVLVGAGYLAEHPDVRKYGWLFLTRPAPVLAPSQIVVAPFVNQTGDSTLDPFGDDAATWIATKLREGEFDVVDPQMAHYSNYAVTLMPAILRRRGQGMALAEETSARTAVVGTYYRDERGVRVIVNIVDVPTETIKRTVGTFTGRPDRTELIDTLGMRTVVAMQIVMSRDTTPGAQTAALTQPPTPELFHLVSTAWDDFFAAPWDTVPVFLKLNRATALAPTYAAPLLMKAYILDVKRQWAGVDQIMTRLKPLERQLSPIERASYDMFAADLRGDSYGRLHAARELMHLGPGSEEMAVLVTLSALYVGRTSEALGALKGPNPYRGMNLLLSLKASFYWEWRCAAEHEAGDSVAEEHSAEEGIHWFPAARGSVESLVRMLAARGDQRRLSEAFARGIGDTTDPRALRMDLMLLAGREARAHGHLTLARTLFDSVADQVRTVPAMAPIADRKRQAAAFYEAGRYREAQRVYQGLFQRDSLDLDVEGRLGVIALRLGDTPTALRIRGHLASLKRPYLFGRSSMWLAHFAALASDNEEAVRLIHTAVLQGYRLMDLDEFTLHQDADFVELRKTPVLKAMLVSLREADVS